MAIEVQYAPDIRLLGATAFGIGSGEYQQRQQERAQDKELAWAQLGEQARQNDAARISRENSQIFGHAADMNRLAFGAGIQGEQRAFELRARQAQLEEQRAFQEKQMEREAEINKQAMLDRMSAAGQQRKDEMEREREAIESAGLMPEQKEIAMQQWHAKHGGFDPAVYAIPEGQKPGDIFTDAGIRYRVDPTGKIQKIGLAKPENLGEFFAKETFEWTDPNTGLSARYGYNQRGELYLLDTPKPEKPAAPEKPLIDPAKITDTWLKIHESLSDPVTGARPDAAKVTELTRQAMQAAAELSGAIQGSAGGQLPPPAPVAPPVQPTPEMLDELMRQFNPFGDAPAPQAAPVEQPPSSAPPIVKSDAEWAALPPGTVYYAPNGELKRKR